jgi:hypothetical protein
MCPPTAAKIASRASAGDNRPERQGTAELASNACRPPGQATDDFVAIEIAAALARDISSGHQETGGAQRVAN